MPSKNTIAHLNEDLNFLIACCHIDPCEDDINFILSYLNTEHLEHNALISLANQHGVLPLVYKTIKKIVEDDSSFSSLNTSHVTPSTLEHLLTELKSAYSQIARRNMLMSAELIRIMKLFEKNGIAALAFKGPTLAQMVYGDITLRQYSDLDILVDEKDAYKAGKLMSENGHTAILPLTILSNKTSLNTVKDFSLISKLGGVHTELHWRLFKKKYNISFYSCMIDKKCQTIKINSKEIKTLQNELLLIYLCLHGAVHTFERIEWICDIDRLIHGCDLNWEEAINIAKQTKSERSFYLGLSLAHHLLYTSLPIELKKNIDRVEIHALQTMVLKRMLEKHNSINNLRYHILLLDTLVQKINFMYHHIFTPTKEDYKTTSLPPLLYPLYSVSRLFRFLKKIIIKKKQ